MLKIDLLPRHFAIARKNKALLALFGVLLLVAAAGWFFQAKSLAARIEKVKEETEKLQPIIQEVDKLTKDTQAKQSEMAPIKAKVDFANEADKSGRGYWKAFHAINDYIWEDAQVSNFSITPPSSVSFTVRVKGTVGAGRFLMNLLRCPAITGITMNGLPAGQGIAGTGGAGVPAGAPGMPGAPGVPPGAPMPAPAPPGAPPGMPGAMPGAPGGMPGAPGAAAAGQGAPGSPQEELTFNITAQLTADYMITVPQPGGGAAAAGPGGMPEMPGAPGMPAGAPGPAAGPAPGPSPAAPGARKGGGGGDEGGGGGIGGKKGGGEEGI